MNWNYPPGRRNLPTPELQDTTVCYFYFLWYCVQHCPLLHKATLHDLHSNLVCEGCAAVCDILVWVRRANGRLLAGSIAQGVIFDQQSDGCLVTDRDEDCGELPVASVARLRISVSELSEKGVIILYEYYIN